MKHFFNWIHKYYIYSSQEIKKKTIISVNIFVLEIENLQPNSQNDNILLIIYIIEKKLSINQNNYYPSKCGSLELNAKQLLPKQMWFSWAERDSSITKSNSTCHAQINFSFVFDCVTCIKMNKNCNKTKRKCYKNLNACAFTWLLSI
jgi:hypothetical protein